MAKQIQKRKGANGYNLPDPLPKGEILVDIAKKKWKLGCSIGQGGFGEIYMAQEADTKSTNFPYVVKIEPHENGPLFVEINFYIRHAKPQEVEDFKNRKKLKTLGMPTYVGSGSHEYKNQKYRFLIMPKFGTDIWKIFLENRNTLPTATVFKLGVQILDVLEYIHERGYVHADIKGANILLGSSKENKDQCYLVDFGLATKYHVGKEFKPNPKKAHDGTIEYLSRDAHQGVPTRRGDIEILSYNLIQWLGCKLPWEADLSKPMCVQASKEEHMSDVTKLMRKCFGTKTIPAAITELLKYIKTLTFDEEPDYVKIRKFFISEIERNNEKLSSPLLFSSIRQTSPSKRKIDQKKTNTKKMKQEEVSQEIECKKDPKEVKRKQLKLQDIKPKMAKTAIKDEFEGYTPEMKAIAMKKMQNGVKKTQQNVQKMKNSETNGESSIIKEKRNGEVGRPRRKVKEVDYVEST